MIRLIVNESKNKHDLPYVHCYILIKRNISIKLIVNDHNYRNQIQDKVLINIYFKP